MSSEVWTGRAVAVPVALVGSRTEETYIQREYEAYAIQWQNFHLCKVGVFECRQLAEYSFDGGGEQNSPSIDATPSLSDQSSYNIISIMNRYYLLISYGLYDLHRWYS